jgi:hypothetical protein
VLAVLRHLQLAILSLLVAALAETRRRRPMTVAAVVAALRGQTATAVPVA